MSDRPEILSFERPSYSGNSRPLYTGPERPVYSTERPVTERPERPEQPGPAPKPEAYSPGDATADSPPNAPVKGVRSKSDLTFPPVEDADHPDLEIKVNDQKTLKLRWHKDLGYVVIGEKNGSGEMKLYTQEEFAEANKGQLETNGGGRIPGETSKKPEFFVPPQGDQSLIYRWDPETQKDVIVGYRVNGERHYFQSRATMELVNAEAEEAGLKTPDRPLPPPGKAIPKADDHNGGYIPQFAGATNGEDGKTYLWRWDRTSGRYVAVAEGSSGSDWHWYTKEEYMEKNSGPNALKFGGVEQKAPVADGRGEMYETGNQEFKIVLDDQAGHDGDGDECWGTPIYVYDKNTGHKVYVGVKVYVGDGKEKNYYFDSSEMKLYNNHVQGEGGNWYWQAKPFNEIDSKNQRIQDGSQESGADDWR